MNENLDIQPEIENSSAGNHGAYGATLFDPRWKARRKEILERDHHRCVICHSAESLQVHHRQYHFVKSMNVYKNPWEYDDSLLITLCESCHKKGHGQYKVPVKQITNL